MCATGKLSCSFISKMWTRENDIKVVGISSKMDKIIYLPYIGILILEQLIGLFYK